MTTWTSEELDKIGLAEELDIATLRSDGTLRKRVTIWVVRVGEDIYVRAYKGPSGPWFRGVQTRHAGHVWAGGVEKDVTFVEETDPAANDRIGAAYLAKYARYPEHVAPMLTSQAREATIKLVPQ
jgi:hypothetical protein